MTWQRSQHYTNSPGQAHWNRSFASLDASRIAERPTFNQVLAALVYQKTAQLRACIQFIWTIRLIQKVQHEELLHSTHNSKTEFFSMLTKRPHLYLYLQAIKMDDLLQPWSPGGREGVLNRCLGREVRPGCSTLTLFKTQFSDFHTPFETEFKIFRLYLRHLTQVIPRLGLEWNKNTPVSYCILMH